MKRLVLITFICISFVLQAQEDEVDQWDNQLFIGNKISSPHKSWKFSGELQVRLKDNMQALDRWFVEGVASYLATEHWEIVPDYRFSVKADEVEHRPGLGILRKDLVGSGENKKHQLVHQLKWQADISNGDFDNGLRYVFFYNYVKNSKFVPNAAAGLFYRWSESFTGIQFLRFGAGLSYLIDVKHAINLSYFVGLTNTGADWTAQGIPLIQLVINLDSKYKYLPARFINF